MNVTDAITSAQTAVQNAAARHYRQNRGELAMRFQYATLAGPDPLSAAWATATASDKARAARVNAGETYRANIASQVRSTMGRASAVVAEFDYDVPAGPVDSGRRPGYPSWISYTSEWASVTAFSPSAFHSRRTKADVIRINAAADYRREISDLAADGYDDNVDAVTDWAAPIGPGNGAGRREWLLGANQAAAAECAPIGPAQDAEAARAAWLLATYPDAAIDAETAELRGSRPEWTDPAVQVRELIDIGIDLGDLTFEDAARRAHRVILDTWTHRHVTTRTPSHHAVYVLLKLAALIELTGDARFASTAPLPADSLEVFPTDAQRAAWDTFYRD